MRPAPAAFAVAIFVVLGLMAAGCAETGPSPMPNGTIEVDLVAGPVCPVEQVPPDPNCAPRPVADREIVLLDDQGSPVASGRSDVEGHLTFLVPPGAYVLRAAPSEGFPTPPTDQPVTVALGAPATVTLEFDTGIR